MFYDYVNLEIAEHTALSDAQYLELNLPWQAEICSSIGHAEVFTDVFVRVFRQGTKYFLKELNSDRSIK